MQWYRKHGLPRVLLNLNIDFTPFWCWWSKGLGVEFKARRAPGLLVLNNSSPKTYGSINPRIESSLSPSDLWLRRKKPCSGCQCERLLLPPSVTNLNFKTRRQTSFVRNIFSSTKMLNWTFWNHLEFCNQYLLYNKLELPIGLYNCDMTKAHEWKNHNVQYESIKGLIDNQNILWNFWDTASCACKVRLL